MGWVEGYLLTADLQPISYSNKMDEIIPEETKPEKRNVFRENWNKVDETCPTCNQVTKRQRGLTKQNLKRLITPRWDLNELMITFMIIMVLVLAYSYKVETQTCRDYVKEYESNWLNMTGGSYAIENQRPANASPLFFPTINISIIKVSNELNLTNETSLAK